MTVTMSHTDLLNFNVPLAKAVLDRVIQYPEQHNQDLWFAKPAEDNTNACGTVGCLAGWTTHIALEQIGAVDAMSLLYVDRNEEGMIRRPDRMPTRSMEAKGVDFDRVGRELGLEPYHEDQHLLSVSLVAQQLLGLTFEAALELFYITSTGYDGDREPPAPEFNPETEAIKLLQDLIGRAELAQAEAANA